MESEIKVLVIVILFRSIITAGHCICTGRQKYTECKKNPDKNTPVNQIIPGRDIYYIVGQQIIDERLLSDDDYGEVLYSLPKAQKAFTYWHKSFLKKDLGILIVDIKNWDSRVLHNIVKPIELPEKG